MEEIERLIEMSDVLYFSTVLLLKNKPLIKDWWYFSPSTGQHISFYSKKTLEYIADKFNLYLATDCRSTHILSKKPINKFYFVLLKTLKIYNRVRKMGIQKIFRIQSKTVEDMKKCING
jgi:hypothetical protein